MRDRDVRKKVEKLLDILNREDIIDYDEDWFNNEGTMFNGSKIHIMEWDIAVLLEKFDALLDWLGVECIENEQPRKKFVIEKKEEDGNI